MKPALNKNFLYQLGYGGLGMLLAGAIIASIAYFFIYPATFKKPVGGTDEDICYINPPDSSRFIVDHGDTYELLKPKAPITGIQMFYHASEYSDTQVINGKERIITKSAANPDGTIGHGTWMVDPDDKSAFDLRFVDVTDEIANPTPGVFYIDVYLKQGAPIPAFIENFCSKKEKLPKILILPDEKEKTFPPYTIDVSTITGWHCAPKNTDGATAADCNKKLAAVPTTGKYYLYSYDTPGSYLTGFIERTGIMPYGSIDITFQGETKSYKTVYAGGWESKHIGVYATNPDDPSQQVVYRYIKEDLLDVEHKGNPYIQANLAKKQGDDLQLDYFTPWMISHTGWWTPECKPAIYLYPTKDTMVNVKVTINNGFLTYTDPLYPKDSGPARNASHSDAGGWNVLAKPNGDLHYFANLSDSKGQVNYPTGIFPYLYYEGKINDSSISKPTKGFVKAYDELSTFFDDTLPTLGLNQKESQEFKQYWLKALPKSPYYFIGILPQSQLDALEPLSVTPKEDTMIRVRLYFEALDQFKVVEQPSMQTPTRSGFTVVDWGGMVKADKNHPFTCLQ